MEKNQGKRLTNNPIRITKAIKIAHFILIIVLVIMAGLYIVDLMLNMAGAYEAVNDPCKICESITGYKCERGPIDILCTDDDCIQIDLTE